MEGDAGVVLAHLDTEVEIEAKVTHLEGGLHLRLERLNLRFCVGDDNVVDVDTHQQDGATAAPRVHRSLMHALLEAHLLECVVQLGVPRVSR